MNKIIKLFAFSFFATLFLVAQAQDNKMEIYNLSGELIESGSFLYVTGGTSSKTINTDSLFIKNISDEIIKLKVRKTETVMAGTSFSKFWALVQLVDTGKTITPNYWELEAGSTTPDSAFFRGSYSPMNNLGTSSITYTFLSVDDNGTVLDSVYICYAFSNTTITPFNTNDGVLYNREVLINCDPAEINEYPISLYNHTIANISCRVQKIIEAQEEGQDVYFNYGGVEYDGASSDGVSIAADETLEGVNGFIAKFNANGIDGNEFNPTVQYRFFNALNGNDDDLVTLVYHLSGVGFSDLSSYSVSSPFPNPAVTSFRVNFDLPDFKQASLNIYAANGALLGKYNLNESKGTTHVSVSALTNGVYFYSIEIDGKTIGVEKVIVQK